MKKAKYELAEAALLSEAEQRQYLTSRYGENWLGLLMDDQLGRSYLNLLHDVDKWELEQPDGSQTFSWLMFQRLPIRPGEEETNQLLSSWQSV